MNMNMNSEQGAEPAHAVQNFQPMLALPSTSTCSIETKKYLQLPLRLSPPTAGIRSNNMDMDEVEEDDDDTSTRKRKDYVDIFLEEDNTFLNPWTWEENEPEATATANNWVEEEEENPQDPYSTSSSTSSTYKFKYKQEPLLYKESLRLFPSSTNKQTWNYSLYPPPPPPASSDNMQDEASRYGPRPLPSAASWSPLGPTPTASNWERENQTSTYSTSDTWTSILLTKLVKKLTLLSKQMPASSLPFPFPGKSYSTSTSSDDGITITSDSNKM